MTPGRQRPAALLRVLLTPLAESQGLDYDLEILQPGERPQQTAYHLVYCGAQLLLGLTYPDSFPAQSRKHRKRGARLIRQFFAEDTARGAAVFLAQALGTLMAEMRVRAELPEEAERHLALCDIIEQTFPLSVEQSQRLDSLRAEFSTDFDEQQARLVWILEAAPERSLDTVLSAESYAAIRFRTRALLHAIRITLGDEYSEALTLSLPGLISSDALQSWGADQASWNFVGGWWVAFARLALGLDPGDEMPWS